MIDILREHWIKVIITLATTGLFGSIAKKTHELQKKVKKLSEHYEANSNGTRSLLKDRISQRHRYHMEKEYIYHHDLEIFCDMVNSYQRLGGNSVIPDLLREVRTLPIKYLNI